MNKLRLWFLSNKTMVKKSAIWSAAVIGCLALIGTAIWIFTGPLSGKSGIDWSMQGYLVSADGQIIKAVDISIEGKIQKDPEKPDTLTLDITLPGDFPYSLKSRDVPKYYSASDDTDVFPYYICSGFIYNKTLNASEICAFALDEEKEMVIFLWPDNPGQYLVASNSKMDPKDLLTHFQTFVEAYTCDK